uniref:SFRICE_019852 n=1 Tax=Spodoptera frugiperda TaxID=7108 RepID=A0A2H1X0U9_SPOFR
MSARLNGLSAEFGTLCELTWIENPNVQQLGRKPASHDHLAWSVDPPFFRELYSLNHYLPKLHHKNLT